MPIKCTCPGHYTDRWTRWRVLNRDTRSRLYCLDCRKEWRSDAKYVPLLPDHSKRQRGGLTDEEVIERIRDGSLVVDTAAAIVSSHGKPLAVIERTHRDGENRGTYRFVAVNHDGRQKKVALHRLVWMAANGRTVPAGYDVDHVNNQGDDSIGNLRLLPSAVNRGLPHRKSEPAGDAIPF